VHNGDAIDDIIVELAAEFDVPAWPPESHRWAMQP
jgi:hypothetical protein